jgi:hypothetical protein
MDDLIDSIALHGLRHAGPRRARAEPISCEYVRELTFADIETLQTIPLDAGTPPLIRLRATHHALARLLASGMKPMDAAASTGHSVGTVNRLQSSDRGFIELIEHYKDLAKEQFVDIQARLALLGTAAAETLMERLEEEPERFTNNELMKLAEVTLDRSIAPAKGLAGRGGSAPSGPVSVSVTFVSPGGTPVEPPASPPLIEIKPEEPSDGT